MIKHLASVILVIALYNGNVKAQSLQWPKIVAGHTPGNMYYELFTRPEGDLIKKGQIVKISMTQKLNDSIMFTNAGKMSIYAPVGETNPYDVSELWGLMKKGDSVHAVQLVDTFITRGLSTLPDGLKRKDSINTYIRITGVFDNDSLASADAELERDIQLKKEVAFLSNYLKQQNIKTISTPGGALVEIIEEGTGNIIDSGAVVDIMYRGKAWDGRVIDTNMDESFGHTDPVNFTTGARMMIRGLDEGVCLLKQGSRARIYIPSMLGYGESGIPNTSIGPFENMVFEVKVVKVKKQ